MVYYSDDKILIRTIVEKDPMNLLKEELEQGQHTTVDRYTTRIYDQESGKAIALVAYSECKNDDDLILFLSKKLR